MQNAATRAATPAVTMLNAVCVGILRPLSSLFEVTAAADRETALHRVLLFVVLCIGAVLRFWGLGDPGLHGDEDTVIPPAESVIRTRIIESAASPYVWVAIGTTVDSSKTRKLLGNAPA